MNDKISIIIPVYNAEKYIKRCIKSIKSQTYENYEAIFIDDGSTDKSLEIIQENINNKMIVITQKNKGVSTARNIGIYKATGDYITFIDSDDEYMPNYLEEMHKNIVEENADISICNYVEVYNNTEKNISLPINKTNLNNDEIKKELVARMIGKEKNDDIIIWGTVWRNLIKISFLKDTGITFDEKIQLSEDFMFLIELYCNAHNITIIDKNLYKYYRNQTSALNKYTEDALAKNLYNHNKLIEIINKYKLEKLTNIRYKKNRFRMYTTLISNAVRQENKKKEINEIEEIIKNYKEYNGLSGIYKNLNLYERINYILLMFKAKRLLRIIYKIKEKLRLRTFQ